jgi:biopolymer transport protein ExbD/biopolymer transport protein TolR
VLAITNDGRLFINAVPVQNGDLRRRIEEVFETKTEKLVIIKADEDVEYKHVMDAMDDLRASGIEDMGLITERKGGNSALSGGQ